jgi:hypothetical protein
VFERKASRTSDLKSPGDEVVRFIGVSLAGGKSDKACVAVLEYYREKNKIFLSRLFDKIK